jgi:hypothetical protein
VHHQGGASRPDAAPHRSAKLFGAPHPRGSGQHSAGCRWGQQDGWALLRPTGRRGPCADGRPGWPAQPACACAAGSRGYGCDAGCWAGKYAWSREDSHILGRRLRIARCGQESGRCKQRPANGTGDQPPGQTRVTSLCQTHGSLSSRHACATWEKTAKACTPARVLLASCSPNSAKNPTSDRR